MTTEFLREWHGCAIPLEGEQNNDVVEELQREHTDVEVEAEFKCGPYNGMGSLDTKRFRTVGVRDEGAGDYHHINILSLKEFLPADLATIYRYR